MMQTPIFYIQKSELTLQIYFARFQKKDLQEILSRKYGRFFILMKIILTMTRIFSQK